MSDLSDFAQNAFRDVARDMIGAESVTVAGGSAVSAVLNEARYSRDFEEGGFDSDERLTAVIDADTWAAAYASALPSYRGETATARGRTWRVDEISGGLGFVELTLISTSSGA